MYEPVGGTTGRRGEESGGTKKIQGRGWNLEEEEGRRWRWWFNGGEK